MTWKQIEPELYYHAHMPDGLTDAKKKSIVEKVSYLTGAIFADIYHETVDFEIIIVEGSIRIKIVAPIAAILTFLAAYGDIRSGSEYLYNDLKTAYGKVAELLTTSHLVGKPICVQRRIGVVGRIDQTLHRYQNHSITLEQCEQRLVELFEIINKSPCRSELLRELSGYISTKYGKTIMDDNAARHLNEIVGLPPRRPEEEQW